MANFCENCGSPVQNDNRFCANCGAPVNQPEPDVPVAPATAPPVGRGAATSAATASSATVATGATAAQGRTQRASVPPQPQQESFRSAMQQQPPQPHYGPQNQEQPYFGQQPGQERLSSGTCRWERRPTALPGPNTNRIRISSPCTCVTTTG